MPECNKFRIIYIFNAARAACNKFRIYKRGARDIYIYIYIMLQAQLTRGRSTQTNAQDGVQKRPQTGTHVGMCVVRASTAIIIPCHRQAKQVSE